MTNLQANSFQLLMNLPLNTNLEMQRDLLDIIQGFSFQMIQVCAWCNMPIGWVKCLEQNKDEISHGICEKCSEKVFKKENLDERD